MATDYGWFQSQRIVSRSKLSPRTTIEGQDSTGVRPTSGGGGRRGSIVPAATSAEASKKVNDGKSFRSQDRTLGEARTARSADSLSDRTVHHGSGVRPHRAMDEATRPRGRGILQPAGGGDFNAASSRHGYSRVAVPTRWPETEGHLVAAPGTRVRLDRPHLAGLVAAFPRATAGGSLAELPPGD